MYLLRIISFLLCYNVDDDDFVREVDLTSTKDLLLQKPHEKLGAGFDEVEPDQFLFWHLASQFLAHGCSRCDK